MMSTLTWSISVYGKGERRYPCRSRRKCKNGFVTSLEKKTRPIFGGSEANANFTHRSTISWKSVALRKYGALAAGGVRNLRRIS